MNRIQSIIPLFSQFENYTGSDLKKDLIAGITVGIMLIPQGMAYALIAGLPPEYGLYASLVPLILYAVLGTSRHLAVGPVALVALLIASAVSPVAETPDEYIAYSILLALMVGVLQLLFGLLKMGFLVNLLSHPVLSGFISAAAIIIGLSQLHHLLGIQSVSGGLHEILIGVVTQLTGVHLITLAVGLGAIVMIIAAKKKLPSLPGPVLAVAAGILLILLSGLDARGVTIVGAIPAGLPAFSLPLPDLDVARTLFPMAVAISLVAYMEAIAVAKAIQQKAKSYKVDANQELIALGTANIGGAFFNAFPVTGSFSRSAVTFDSGGKTTLSSLVAAVVVASVLLFFTGIFYYLPTAILAAIIMVSVFGLIEWHEFRRLWGLGHYDRYLFLATFAGTLFIGIKEGILLGVTLSVVMLLYRSARPNFAVMGRIPGTKIFRDASKYKTEEEQEVLVYRFDAPVHFANAEYFSGKVLERVEEKPGLSTVIFDLNGVNEMDSTGVDELFKVIQHLADMGIGSLFAEVKYPVRSIIRDAAAEETEFNFYMTVDDAIGSLRSDLTEKEKLLHLDTH
ncbi:MAG: sulfate permease [Balneolaceae bacterium]|nr:MAG: sulfate permease [Balneolaceae bacterium]